MWTNDPHFTPLISSWLKSSYLKLGVPFVVSDDNGGEKVTKMIVKYDKGEEHIRIEGDQLKFEAHK